MSTCKICGKPVTGRGLCRAHYQQAWRKGEFGDPKKADRPLHDRLMEKCRKTANGCMEWTGGCNEFGYGEMQINNKRERVHRVSFMLANGYMPRPPMIVCHRCDNPPCFNSEHLFEGTIADNQLDAAAKGRMPHGAGHWNNKLSPEAVHFIRSSDLPHRELAAMFGVNQSQISRVRAGKRQVKL